MAGSVEAEGGRAAGDDRDRDPVQGRDPQRGWVGGLDLIRGV